MDTHNNARLTPKGREEMVRAVVDYGLTKAAHDLPIGKQTAALQK